MTAAAIRLIAGKDAAELRRDRRLVIATVLTALLALAAVLTTYARLSDYQRDRSAAAAMERDSWLNQGPRDPHSAAHFSQWAFRPLTAPALLDPGTTGYAGSAVWMEAHARNPAAFRAVEDRTAALDLGEFSAAWVLEMLVPLLLLVLAAGVVARERERGTLRLMLASGMPARLLVRGKTTGMLQVAALIAAPLLAAALAAIWLVPGPVDTDTLARAALWCLVHAMLLVIAALIGVAVSSRARTAAGALAAVIGLWVVAVPLAPRVAATLAEAVAPTPSGQRFWADAQQEIEEGFAGSGNAEQRAAALEAGLLRRYGVATVEQLPISFRGASLDDGERFGNRVFARRWAMLEGIEDRQRAIMRVASIVTPLIAVQNLSAALAGTDNAHQRNFTAQAETERQRVVNALNRDVMINGAGVTGYKADARLWRALDGFRVTSMPLSRVWRTVWPDGLILFGWLAAALLLLRWAGQRLAAELAL